MSGKERLLNLATLLTSFSAIVVAAAVVHREFFPGVASGQTPAYTMLEKSRPIPNWQMYEAGGHRIGATNPVLTLVEFGDYECPACGAFARVARAVLPRHPNDVALVFRYWPLPYHRFAYPAARAAECAADQDRFAAYHDALYETQDSLGLVSFDELAHRASVPDIKKFRECDARSERVAVIDSGIAAAKRLQAHGTPTILANGVLLAVAPDSSDLEQMIAVAKKTATARK